MTFCCCCCCCCCFLGDAGNDFDLDDEIQGQMLRRYFQGTLTPMDAVVVAVVVGFVAVAVAAVAVVVVAVVEAKMMT